MSSLALGVRTAGLFVLLVASASAEHMTVQVTDVAHIVSAEGEARVLLKFEAFQIPDRAVLLRANLVLPQPATETRATYDLVVAPISHSWNSAAVTWSSWDRAGGDFVGAHWGHCRPEFGPAERVVVADLGSMVNRWASGRLESHGVLIMPHPNIREGLDGALVDLFYESGGRLEIDFKRVGPPRPGRRHG